MSSDIFLAPGLGQATSVADNIVTTAKIVNGTILAEDLATGSVTSLKILDATIDELDLDASVNASLTLANSAAQNAFKTVSVSGQSDIVADSATDVLTLVAGTGVTITTNASTDAVTINASGFQPLDTDLTTLSTAFVTASASGAASLALAEDTDNGTNKVTIIAPAAVTSDRTATLQDADGIIAYLANITGTNSGTNTGDQNLFSTISVSGQSDVVADTTSDTLTLVAGTGITLTTNAGSDSITVTNSAGSGATVLLDTQTASTSTTLNFNSSLITSTYKSYKLILRNIVLLSGQSRTPWILLSTDNGNTMLTTNYIGARYGYTSGGSAKNNAMSTTEIALTDSNDMGSVAGQSLNGEIDLLNLASTVNAKAIEWKVQYYNSAGDTLIGLSGSAGNSTTSAINYVRFQFSSSTITSGTIELYGVL